MISWLLKNKEWVFSGLGVFLMTFIIGLFIRKKTEVVQKQKTGNNCTNIQSTGSVEVKINHKED